MFFKKFLPELNARGIWGVRLPAARDQRSLLSIPAPPAPHRPARPLAVTHPETPASRRSSREDMEIEAISEPSSQPQDHR